MNYLRRSLTFVLAALMLACSGKLEADLVSDDSGDRRDAVAQLRRLPADERARIVAALGDVIRNPEPYRKQSTNPETRAVQVLAQIPDSAGPALPALLDLIEGNLSPTVTANVIAREGAFDVLAAMGAAAQEAVPRLARVIKREQPGSQLGRLGLKTMVSIGDPAVDELKTLAADPAIPSDHNRELYIGALGSIRTPAARKALAELGR